MQRGWARACLLRPASLPLHDCRCLTQVCWTGHRETALAPARVENMSNVHSVACASSHSLCATRDGAVFSWGDGQGGRLGHGDMSARPTPTLIPPALFGNQKVVQVAAGLVHSSALTDCGEVFSWGNGYAMLEVACCACLPRCGAPLVDVLAQMLAGTDTARCSSLSASACGSISAPSCPQALGKATPVIISCPPSSTRSPNKAFA